MEERQRVILYGDSLILTGIQASLEASTSLEVITLDIPPAHIVENLRDLHPAAMIFDLGSISPDFSLAILQRSDLLLIGIDPDTHQALVWSGRQAVAAKAADLIGIIFKRKEKENETHSSLYENCDGFDLGPGFPGALPGETGYCAG